MPAQISFSVNDAAVTPVAHVFAPQGVKNVSGEDVGTWRNLAVAKPLGMEEAVISYARRKADGTTVFKMKLILPTTAVNSTTGKTEIIRSHEAAVTFTLPPSGLVQERKDLRTLLGNALISGQFTTAIDNAEGVW